MRTTNNRLLTQGDEGDDDDNVIKLKHTHTTNTLEPTTIKSELIKRFKL